MKKSRLVFLSMILFGTVGCDQVTKVIAREHLPGKGTLSYLGDTFRLVYAENYGAFLGMGAEMPDGLRRLIFVGVVSVFLAAFFVWLLRTKEISQMTLWASGLVVGGGIGNLIDRIFRDGGGVTDFMNMGIGGLRTGIFNVADIWIVAGVILLFFSPEFRDGMRGDEAEAGEGGDEGSEEEAMAPGGSAATRG